MCGLFGFTVLDQNEISQELEIAGDEALSVLEHRGPDGFGIFKSLGTFVGHRRLSILDLSDNGSQPMIREDNQLAIAVNGEIYNFNDIKQKIGSSRFLSNSDSEVVLHGYAEFGIRSLMELCDGMYAGVVYDVADQIIHLFRDRTGIKPLYYGYVGSCFVWASELKAIEKFASELGLDLEMDNSALLDFAANRYVPAPKTIYRNIFKLRPAHYLTMNLSSDRCDEQCYWSLEFERGGEGNIEEEVRALIHSSVKEQVVSDVPVGFFLSGGVDSSVISYAGSAALDRISTFSIGFDDKNHDETYFAKKVARQIGSSHYEEIVSIGDSSNIIGEMRRWYDEPFADTSALPTYRLCKMAKENCTVALSGDGGDEVFGGYKWYRRFIKYQRLNSVYRFLSSKTLKLRYRRPPDSILEKIFNKLALLAQGDEIGLYSTLMPNLLPSELDLLRRELEIESDYDWLWSLRPHWRPDLGRLKSLQYLDFNTWLPDDILTKVDRVSMANSLEVRVPFLKKELVEFAFSLSDKEIYLNGHLKGLLKASYKGILPDEILYREKKGFSIPTATWRKSILEEHGTFQSRYASKLRNGITEAFPG